MPEICQPCQMGDCRHHLPEFLVEDERGPVLICWCMNHVAGQARALAEERARPGEQR